MKTKLAQLKDLAAANDWRGALRLAATFARLGEHKVAIVRGHEAFTNARFAVQLGRDPAMDIAAGITALCTRYEIDLPAPADVAIPSTDFFADRRAAVRAADRSGLDPAMLEFKKGDKGWYWVDPAIAPVAEAKATKTDPKVATKASPKAKRPAADRATIDPMHDDLPVVQVDEEPLDEVAPDAPIVATSAAVDAPAVDPSVAPADVDDVVPPDGAGPSDDAAPAPKAPRANTRRDAALDMARTGVLPPAPDFSAPTHRGYRRHLAEVVALVEARDVDGLRAYPINPVSSSRRILARYRDAALIALEATGP